MSKLQLNLRLTPEFKKIVENRCFELGMSFTDYFQFLVTRDVDGDIVGAYYQELESTLPPEIEDRLNRIESVLNQLIEWKESVIEGSENE
jgi:hypothetical protein